MHRGSGSRYKAGCPGCRARAKEERSRTGGKYQRAHRIRKYGLTPAQVTDMVLAQDGVCAICHSEPIRQSLHIDHDHETGAVRGLLCENCNRGIGMFRDNPHLLARAADYLKEPSWT